ncbi:60S ribosomal protein L32-like [Eptesicus fuscus]|uniref:60S ribosomal protein L32-like n=1 Tax=Eptesicus fuscus TaxID=29078 RepID=UPI0024045A65|nr:60S ribosomal protein L32-like [Eptesicus fuscus]
MSEKPKTFAFQSLERKPTNRREEPEAQGTELNLHYVLFLGAACGGGGHLLLGTTAALRPLVKPKRTKEFIRHQSDRYVKIKRNWWKPGGIDNGVRRRFQGQILMPNIGYGSNRKTRHTLPSGCRKFPVLNVKELQVLLMRNKSYCADCSQRLPEDPQSHCRRAAQRAQSPIPMPITRLRSEGSE